ncbi:hypothetical protein N7478_009981 [Penicillium angulare]|uniref:uncharacterized protein n=1 Tax=Penicillium angulare TaxID=116970 RepID=UPI002540673F|nr:uncharacterized protein N7478_009981 [Penicillium angulare]KAJ5267173.1 hypothetical protein N7478_009981 [Penicillium angulare]
MVGVPHSTGCALCRERHIKCDEAVPECSQCQRYGRTCPGYRRIFRFQDEGPSLARRHRPVSRRRDRGLSSRSTTSTPAPAPAAAAAWQIESLGPIEHPDDGAGAATVVRENAIALMRRHSATISLDENVSPSLVRKTFKAAQPQLFLDFITASFPTLYFHNRFRAGNDPGFPEYIMMNFGQDAYLDSAICCLSSVYLAHLTQDPVLLRTSRRMYGVSLGEFIRAISTGNHASSDNMLCTAMMLSVYEMYAQTSPDAWVVHSDAVKRLMTSRGTNMHKSGFGRSCWIAFRGFHVATAVYQGKPCFLDQKEWQDYASQTMAEDAQKPGEWAAYAVISDKVFMEIAKCPRYISETRNLLSGSSTLVEIDHGFLIRRIQDTSHRLHALSAELRSCINAHSQRQQGIIRRPGTFVGPVPEVFPETGPSLLLRGAENIQDTLRELCNRLEGKFRCRVIEGLSPDSGTATLSDGSEDTPSPPTISPRTLTLPFRIHSELGRGPSRTSDRDDPRAVIWLDRVASSMGVLGTKVLTENEPPLGCIEEED